MNVGHAMVSKPEMRMPRQRAEGGAEDEIAGNQANGQTLMHAHAGHTQLHPVALRHRKGSADPLHGEEDKLVDEYKDLYEKAGQGMCTGLELMRLREIRGQLKELQGKRQQEAQAITAAIGSMSPASAASGAAGAVTPGTTMKAWGEGPGDSGSGVAKPTEPAKQLEPAEAKDPRSADRAEGESTVPSPRVGRVAKASAFEAAVAKAEAAVQQIVRPYYQRLPLDQDVSDDDGETHEPTLREPRAYGGEELDEGGWIPRNDGDADAVTRTESVFGTPVDDDAVEVTLPDKVEKGMEPVMVTGAAALWTGYRGPAQQRAL